MDSVTADSEGSLVPRFSVVFINCSAKCLNHALPTAYVFLLLPHNSSSDLSSLHFPSVFFVVDLRLRRRVMLPQFAALNLVKETGPLLGCSDSFRKGDLGLLWVFEEVHKDLDFEGDFSLEAEILEFMNNSKNPKAFATKKELIDSGRMDLVDAISKKGGWLAFGWDLDEENKEGPGEALVKDEDLLANNECDVKHESSKIEGGEIRGSAEICLQLIILNHLCCLVDQ